MKKILSALAILAFFSVSFTACKKEKTKTTAEKIIGQWQVDNLMVNDHSNGADHTISSNDFTSTDFYEFKTDGTVNISIKGDSGSTTYTLSGEDKLVITDDETYDIKTLNDHSLVLYFKDGDTNEYEEVTITFKR